MNRRNFVGGLAGAGVANGAMGAPASKTKRPPPKPPTADQLQDGDFLWPRDPKAWIPVLAAKSRAQAREIDADRAGFEAQRKAYLAAHPGDARIAQLTYDQYRRAFDLPDTAETRALHALFSVGHVAIVSLKPGKPPSLIEAVYETSVRAVREKPFDQWMKDHASDWVFQGRLKDHTPADRARISAQAATQLGKPYQFFNFDLMNTDGFYCSKLAWYSVFTALKIQLDDQGPKRLFWFSPKMMFNLPKIQHLNGDCCYLD